MPTEEVMELALLRQEVKKDIQLAIANFKVWLLVTVLSNMILIGVPALYVFFSTTNTAQTALNVALESKTTLEGRSAWISRTDMRLTTLERHLEQSGFQPPTPEVLPR